MTGRAFWTRGSNGIRPAPLDGLARGGYRLVYTAKPSEYSKSYEHIRHITDLLFSLGVIVDHAGVITEVMWEGPAFKAGATVGSEIVAVNGATFNADILKDAVADAQTNAAPVRCC